MIYKIFFENRLLLLTDKTTDNIANQTHYYKNLHDLKSFIETFEADKSAPQATVCHQDIELLFEQTQKCFRIISAAGGTVLNEDNELLVIRRRGRWDLPKGKIDQGESEKDAAVREVTEECGLTGIIRGKLRCISYHTYKHKNQMVLKPTYWFNMTAPKNQELTPQTEEDIEAVCWVKLEDIPSLYDETFLSIKDVLATFVK